MVPLHQRLGERLAGRVNAGHAQSHVIGNIRELKIADFAVPDTPLVGRTIGEIKLEEATGVHIIAVWKRGRLLPASPDIVLSQESVGSCRTADQMMELDLLLVIYATNYHPALVIGGGKVRQATGSNEKIYRFICWSATKSFAPNSTISPTVLLSAMQPTARC